MPTDPPGTEDSAFLTFAILDELIRTSASKMFLTSEEVADMLGRVEVSVRSLKRPQAERCLPIIHNMLDEYRE